MIMNMKLCMLFTVLATCSVYFINETTLNVFYEFCTKPIYWIYRNGPLMFGGWLGQTDSDICNSLTHVSAQFWMDHPDTCLENIKRHFNSWCITIFLVIGSLLSYQILSHFLAWNFIYKPMFQFYSNKKRSENENPKNESKK
jgi:hypothetical protein